MESPPPSPSLSCPSCAWQGGVEHGTLTRCSFAWQGAVALAKSLRAAGAPVLKELHIWSNHIGDAGRVAFEEALSTHT